MEALEDWERVAAEEGVPKAELPYRLIVFNTTLEPEHGNGVVIGASNSAQLENTLSFCDRGPLSHKGVQEINAVWQRVKEEARVENYQAVFGPAV